MRRQVLRDGRGTHWVPCGLRESPGRGRDVPEVRQRGGVDEHAGGVAERGGFRTKGKKPHVILGEVVEGDGRRFTNYSVRDMLKNRFYLGEVRYKEECFEGPHHGLISVELFEAVRERMAKNRSRRSVYGNVKSEHPHLLSIASQI